jgi:hypothetical protein
MAPNTCRQPTTADLLASLAIGAHTDRAHRRLPWRTSMNEQGWRGFLDAEGVDDWVVLHGGSCGQELQARHRAEAFQFQGFQRRQRADWCQGGQLALQGRHSGAEGGHSRLRETVVGPRNQECSRCVLATMKVNPRRSLPIATTLILARISMAGQALPAAGPPRRLWSPNTRARHGARSSTPRRRDFLRPGSPHYGPCSLKDRLPG